MMCGTQLKPLQPWHRHCTAVLHVADAWDTVQALASVVSTWYRSSEDIESSRILARLTPLPACRQVLIISSRMGSVGECLAITSPPCALLTCSRIADDKSSHAVVAHGPKSQKRRATGCCLT
jgi:hypothetical protein